jgi:hypothetical protein
MPIESLSLADALPPLDLLDQARFKLRRPVYAERTWPAVLAAAFFAATALAFATASIMAPPLTLSHAARASAH